ncbi:TTC21B [Bugula neritina]|uniref:TTC21B n=1 Tax=Bugula neritina TaxID=10212 RepID=A0A7J7JRT3_BUGNE|nr:TTC21B [Bugula neritina]
MMWVVLALLINGDCIEAKKYNILHRLVRESGYEEAATEIGDLIVTIDRIESKNAYLYYNLSALFCRVQLDSNQHNALYAVKYYV